MPNWLKYGLGLNPMVPGIVLPDGVIWANAGQVGGTNMTDKVQIFTAAEVVYNTEVGKTYQLQAISSLDGGWKNIGDPVVATASRVSLVTPTRTNQQQFYRVQITVTCQQRENCLRQFDQPPSWQRRGFLLCAPGRAQ